MLSVAELGVTYTNVPFASGRLLILQFANGPLNIQMQSVPNIVSEYSEFIWYIRTFDIKGLPVNKIKFPTE